MPNHLLCPRGIHPYQVDWRLHVAHRDARLERALPSAPNPWFKARRCVAYENFRFLRCLLLLTHSLKRNGIWDEGSSREDVRAIHFVKLVAAAI